jgi:iron complex outermembrane receptor protein
VDLKYDHVFENQLEVMARGFYDHVDYDGDFIYDQTANAGDPPFLVINKDFARGRWLGGEVLLTKELFARHRVSLGTEYRSNIRQDQENYDSAPFFQKLDDKRRSDVWAVYIQDEFHILDNLILNAGVRHDHYSTFGGTTNPRVALIYKPFEKTALKFLFGQAFRSPNAYESFYDDGGTSQKGNPQLKPERITDYELVYEQYYAEHFRSSVTGFYQIMKDIITAQEDPVDDLIVYKNTDEIKSEGVELALEGNWENGLTGRASYTFQDAKNQNKGKMLGNSTRHLFKYNMIVPLLREKLFAGAEVQYTSSRKTVNENTAGGFLIANITLFSHNILKDLEFSASVYNLFDKKYGDPLGPEQIMDMVEQDGRTFRLKLTYSF